MSLTFAVVVLLFLLWLLVLGRYMRRCVDMERRGRHYLEVIGGLRQLFEHLPRHRGMANGYLQGDASFKAGMKEAQQRIDQAINQLEPLLSSAEEEPLAWRWQRLRADWQGLKSEVATMAAAESFQAHTRLVMEVIYLFEDAAARVGACEADAGMARLREILFNQLPIMVEFIARARGVGTGVASRQTLLVADRVKLGFLARRVEQTISRSSQTLSGVLAGQGVQRSIVDECRQLTLGFIDLLNGSLLTAERITIKPEEYYDAGTAAIGKGLALFDGLLPLVVEQAHRSHRQLRSKVARNGTAAAVAGVGLILLAVT